jgi:two-component system, chemotaxis family, chemotaxis protein CheY
MGHVIIFTVVLPTLLVGLFAYCLYLTKGIEREHFSQVFNMEPKALRILIVDDSEITRRVVGTILRSRNWTICGEAENGRTGVEKFQKVKPDVVLLDLSMPDMTGLEAAQQMSASNPTIPLILFTILDIEGIGNAAREAGIRAIVPKSEAWNLIPNIERVACQA